MVSPAPSPTATATRASATPSLTPDVSPTPSPSPTVVPTPTPTAPPTARPTPRPTARPTPTPTPRPTARPTPTPAPTPIPPSRLLTHGPRDRDQVALTFDMGGRVGDALDIVDYLIANEVHASIFMTGAMADNVNTSAGRQVLARIEANPALLTLGNHSYTHRDFRTLTRAQIRDELRRTEAALRPYCTQDPRPFFRPPNGGYDNDVLADVGLAGYRLTVTWDVDTIDWRPVNNDPPGPTATQIVSKVLGRAQGGSIVLMHLGGYHTFEALPGIVDGLRDAGYELVSLDEMF